MLHEFIQLLTHTKEFLTDFINDHGTMTYALLFVIIFVETGLVVMPFLPGDSLLFAAGTFCAGVNHPLDLLVMIPLLSLAAILGDNTNYAVGRFAGQHALNLRLGNRRLVKQEWLDKTHVFFEKHGTKAIILARFVPIVRTVTPFVAGAGKMEYRKKFLPFDIAGGVLWICVTTLSGFALGQNEFVSAHFEMVVVGIILISVLPMVLAFLRARFSKTK
jgi:membrane-associated protein